MKKTIIFLFLLLLSAALIIPASASDGIEFSGGDDYRLFYGSDGNRSPVGDEEIAAMSSFTVSDYVIDDADLLTGSEETELARYFAAVTKARECAVIAVTKESVDGDIESYTDDLYDYGGYGFGDDHAGVMMLLDMSERKWHITTTGDELIYELQDYIDDMAEAFISGLNGNDDYYSAFYSFGSCVDRILCGEFSYDDDYGSGDDIIFPWGGYDTDWSGNGAGFAMTLPRLIVISLVIGLVVALIIVLAMKGKNKSVRFSSGADYYQKNGTFVLRRQNERFLYHNVTRTPIAQNNDSHHSSGGGGGGSIHVGSSGTSHGGGSGHF